MNRFANFNLILLLPFVTGTNGKRRRYRDRPSPGNGYVASYFCPNFCASFFSYV